MCCTAAFERAAEVGLDAPLSSCRHLALRAEPKSARAARRFVAECAGPLDADTTSTLVLLTSEIVTNAILHARTPLEIGVARTGDRILVSVGDSNLVQPEQQPYSDERTDGRGVVLLAALAERWGVVAHDAGKSVWFVLRLPAMCRDDVDVR